MKYGSTLKLVSRIDTPGCYGYRTESNTVRARTSALILLRRRRRFGYSRPVLVTTTSSLGRSPDHGLLSNICSRCGRVGDDPPLTHRLWPHAAKTGHELM